MVLTDFFDKAYCINLDSRGDKLEIANREFEKHSLNVERFPAINGHQIEYNGSLKRGVIGCALSHRKIIEIAKEQGYWSVLILEDDVQFEEGLNQKFIKGYEDVPSDWDMLYLGGNHNAKVHTERISGRIIRVKNTQATHAYAIKNTVYDFILQRLQDINFDVDVIYKEIQKKCNAYCFSPRLAWQRPSVSDIHGVFVDYSFLRDNDGLHK